MDVIGFICEIVFKIVLTVFAVYTSKTIISLKEEICDVEISTDKNSAYIYHVSEQLRLLEKQIEKPKKRKEIKNEKK